MISGNCGVGTRFKFIAGNTAVAYQECADREGGYVEAFRHFLLCVVRVVVIEGCFDGIKRAEQFRREGALHHLTVGVRSGRGEQVIPRRADKAVAENSRQFEAAAGFPL